MGYSVDELLEEIENLEKEHVDTTNIQSKRERQIKKLDTARKEEVQKSKSRIVTAVQYSLLLIMLYFGGSEIYKKSGYTDYIDYEQNIESLSESERENACIELSEVTGTPIMEDSLLILEGAVENTNLTEDEKKIIYSLTDVISDNPYLDEKEAYKSLRRVDIVYPDRGKDFAEDVLGTYNYTEELIRIFEDNKNHDTATHELIHCLYTNKKTAGLPEYLYEGMTELLSNEYFSDSPFIEIGSYPFEIVMIKQLCEMVGSDNVLKTYSTGDMNIILNELSKTVSKEESEEFLTNVELVFKDYRENDHLTTDDYAKVLAYIDKYYEAKRPISGIITYDDVAREELYSYYRGILELMTKEDSIVQYYYYLLDNGVKAKPYFSKKLLAEYPVLTTILYEESKNTKTNEKIKKRNF